MHNADSITLIINDKYYTFSINDQSADQTGLLNEFDKTNSKNSVAYIDSNHFNIIPDTVFNESKIDTYLSLTTEKLDSITPVTNKIPQLNSTILWTLNEKIKKTLILKNPGITFHHLSELFINEPIVQNLHPEIKLRIAENTIYILCFKQGKLQIVNRFSISGPEDIIYYSLLCIENSGIKRENTFINIKGLYNDQLIDLIKNYFNSNKIFAQKDQSLKSFIK